MDNYHSVQNGVVDSCFYTNRGMEVVVVNGGVALISRMDFVSFVRRMWSMLELGVSRGLPSSSRGSGMVEQDTEDIEQDAIASGICVK